MPVPSVTSTTSSCALGRARAPLGPHGAVGVVVDHDRAPEAVGEAPGTSSSTHAGQVRTEAQDAPVVDQAGHADTRPGASGAQVAAAAVISATTATIPSRSASAPRGVGRRAVPRTASGLASRARASSLVPPTSTPTAIGAGMALSSGAARRCGRARRGRRCRSQTSTRQDSASAASTASSTTSCSSRIVARRSEGRSGRPWPGRHSRRRTSPLRGSPPTRAAARPAGRPRPRARSARPADGPVAAAEPAPQLVEQSRFPAALQLRLGGHGRGPDRLDRSPTAKVVRSRSRSRR